MTLAININKLQNGQYVRGTHKLIAIIYSISNTLYVEDILFDYIDESLKKVQSKVNRLPKIYPIEISSFKNKIDVHVSTAA